MQLIRSRAYTAILCVAAAFSTAACSDDVNGPGAEDTVTIGGLFSLTGGWADLGENSKAALEVAVEDINTALAAGSTRLRFAADVEDTKLDPALALAGAQRLKQRGAGVALGPQTSAELAAIKSYADGNSLIIISQSSTAASLAVANDNVFRLTPGDSVEGLALAALMRGDGITALVPMWRADAGNQGLAAGTRNGMVALGGTASAGHQYSVTETNFTSALAAIKTQVQEAIGRVGVAKVAVSLSAFDDAVPVFRAAASDPVLGSVKWYGTDGTALSAAIENDAVAAAFAVKVGFANAIFGLDDTNASRWQPIAARIKAKTGRDADAFALAVYDGAWLAANAYMTTGKNVSAQTLRTQIAAGANTFFGTTGVMALNAAGDRRSGNFDFVALSAVGAGFDWKRVAQYDTQTGILRR